MYSQLDLDNINEQLQPLKQLADREIASIAGLYGPVYTPHIDTYMQVSIKKAQILADLKTQGILPLSSVEVIHAALNTLHKRTKNLDVVEYKGKKYQRRFTPLKLSKSGKMVRKWAKFWLLQQTDDIVDHSWEQQVREIWPEYFLIRRVDI